LPYRNPNRCWVAVVDRGDQSPHELADPIGFVIDALEDESLDLHRDEALTTAGFDA
jgi:hypothetical protein